MPEKIYTCAMFPQLTIAGVCQFVDGVFSTSDSTTQRAIEKTDSFKTGRVKELDILLGDDGEPWEPPSKTLLAKMKKDELKQVARNMGIPFGGDASRAKLLALIVEAL